MAKKLDPYFVKDLCLKSGFDLVGITEKEPSWNPPGWTNSIIVLAVATPDEALDYTIHIKYNGTDFWSKWIYEYLMARSSLICFRLAKHGVRARPLTFMDSWKAILLKDAAVKAGLGIIGKNNLLVTPRYGPRVRLTAIFTDAEIEPDKEISEDFCSNCNLCIKSCPTGALSENGFTRDKCIAEFDPSEEMLKLQRKKVRYVTKYTRLQCRICMDVCPVGEKIKIENIEGF